MADDLDKYLEGLGIDQGDARTPAAPKPVPATPAYEEPEPELESRPAPVAETAVQAGEVPSVTGSSPAERCESFLVNLLLNLGPTYTAEVREVEDGLQADISGGDSGKLIGRGGRTLAALEYLANAVVNKDESAAHVRVSVDIGGYKERRDERLRGVAQKAAVRARKTGFAVELEPMSAAERRVIHMALADDPAVVSESSGEGKNRRVVVKPV